MVGDCDNGRCRQRKKKGRKSLLVAVLAGIFLLLTTSLLLLDDYTDDANNDDGDKGDDDDDEELRFFSFKLANDLRAVNVWSYSQALGCSQLLSVLSISRRFLTFCVGVAFFRLKEQTLI